MYLCAVFAKYTDMDESLMQQVRLTLTNYLEENKLRKTPERYAILDAIFDFNAHFTLEELEGKMESNNFRVSRATLYNAIKLFMKLRLVVRHNFQQGAKYEANFRNDNHCHQICTICGKVKELPVAAFAEGIDGIKLKRFHKNGFELYIYGICSTCQTKLTRKKSRIKKHTTKKA